MSEALAALLAPTVLAALVAGLVTVVMPYLSARIKRQQNGRVQEVALQVHKLEADQQMLDRLSREIATHQERLRQLEARERAMSDALTFVEAEMTVLRDRLAQLDGGAELIEHALRVLEHIRRGREPAIFREIG